MKLRGSVALAICVFVLILNAAGQSTESAMLPVGSATLTDFGSELSLHGPDGAVLDPVRGMTLEPESVIDTGKNTALLNLQDGSQVLVKSHSHVVLKSPSAGSGYSLELTLGKVIAKVKKRLSNSPSFKMGTPTAVITVRGTRFAVEVDKKQRTRVEVYEGLVEVQGIGATLGSVMLKPGYLTHVQANRAPERPQESMEREGSGLGPAGSIGEGRGEQSGRSGGQESGEHDSGSERESEPH